MSKFKRCIYRICCLESILINKWLEYGIYIFLAVREDNENKYRGEEAGCQSPPQEFFIRSGFKPPRWTTTN
jgi:hypothetical protein